MITKEWRIRFHPAFDLILDELTAVVAKERERDPANYKKSPQTRLLAAIYRAITDEIPANVQHAEGLSLRSLPRGYACNAAEC